MLKKGRGRGSNFFQTKNSQQGWEAQRAILSDCALKLSSISKMHARAVVFNAGRVVLEK